MKDSSESNVDNTGSNIRHSLQNILFKDHLSVKIIREKNKENRKLHLQPISTVQLKKIIIGFDCKKSNFSESILATLLKDTCDTFIPYLTEIINDSFQTNSFPNELKLADITSVYQRKDPVNKESSYPVSVLSHV